MGEGYIGPERRAKSGETIVVEVLNERFNSLEEKNELQHDQILKKIAEHNGYKTAIISHGEQITTLKGDVTWLKNIWWKIVMALFLGTSTGIFVYLFTNFIISRK